MTDGVAAWTHVVPGRYLDSVTLLQASLAIRQEAGLEEVSLVMGTPANLQMLRRAGLLAEPAPPATPQDLVVAARGTRAQWDALLSHLDRWLVRAAPPAASRAPAFSTSIAAAHVARPDADLVLISVPGEHAALLAAQALDRDLDVMIFSDHVPVSEEVGLKRRAAAQGRLVMGPDCGTALWRGRALGFMNHVRPGPVGIVAASGTGAQEAACLLDRWGIGVAAVVGVGSRDLSDEVGGLMTRAALARLKEDPAVQAILVVTKPPGPRTGRALPPLLASLGLPAVVATPGAGLPDTHPTVEEGVRALARLLGRHVPEPAADPVLPLSARQEGYLWGLYAGGTLAYEALGLLRRWGLQPLYSNLAAPGVHPWHPSQPLPQGHLVLDLGDDAFTAGTPHPLLAPSLRARWLHRARHARQVASCVLDLELGYGTAPDPIAPLLAAVPAPGTQGPPVIVHVVGTDADPLPRRQAVTRLTAAGFQVYPTHRAALARAVDALASRASPPAPAGEEVPSWRA